MTPAVMKRKVTKKANTEQKKKRRQSKKLREIYLTSSDAEYKRALPHIFSKKPSKEVADLIGVAPSTVRVWRKLTNTAFEEFGDITMFSSWKVVYKKKFVTDGSRLTKKMKVSKDAVKGLEILLKIYGVLEGSRADNIIKILRSEKKPMPVKDLREKYNLSEWTAVELRKKLRWSNA